MPRTCERALDTVADLLHICEKSLRIAAGGQISALLLQILCRVQRECVEGVPQPRLARLRNTNSFMRDDISGKARELFLGVGPGEFEQACEFLECLGIASEAHA